MEIALVLGIMVIAVALFASEKFPMDLVGAGPDDFQAFLDKVVEEFGGLDAVVHCAARFDGLTPLEQFPPSEWLSVIQVNLNAAWLLSAMSLPLLKKSASGSLYFLLEDLPKMQGAYWGAYGVSKHALSALVNQFNAECKSTNVQVLGINPGVMRTGLRARSYHAENPELQPGAQSAARRIVELLNRQVRPDTPLVELHGN